MATLDIVVLGSASECRTAAQWLTGTGSAAKKAADQANNAWVTGVAGWYGPAADAFAKAAQNPRDLCDDLAYSCEQYSSGLDEFANCLEGLNNRMDDVGVKASGGGLKISGGIIFSPDAAMMGRRPQRSDTGKNGIGFTQTTAEWGAAVDAYNKRVDEYNRLVKLFNECGVTVKEIRVAENQAHVNLRGDLAGEGDVKNWKIGDYNIDKMIDAKGVVDDSRDALIGGTIAQLDEEARRYTTIASADKPGYLDERMLDWYREKAAARGAEKAGLLRILSRYHDGTIPAHLLTKNATPTGIGEYEGRRTGHGDARRPHGGVLVTRAMKAVPFLGDVFTGIDEFADVARGRQSFGAATLRTVGIIGAGMAGEFIGATAGRGAGALLGGRFGPHGAVIGGGIAGAVGGMWLDQAMSQQADRDLRTFIDQHLPDHVNPGQNQEKAAEARHLEK